VAPVRARQLLRSLVKLARRGQTAAPVEPARRRAILIQIDGLSSKRMRQSMARGELQHLKSWLSSGRVRLTTVQAATPPSTPVFQAGLLYGAHGDVPGFGWYDRTLGRIVRMDLAEDVHAIHRALLRATRRRGEPPLLERGVSYGTIWPAAAAEAIFNVVLFMHGRGTPRRAVVRNLWDRALSLLAGAELTGRLASRFFLELGVGLWDFVRWCRRIRSTRFEWRFLYMRLFVSVVMRDVSTQGVILDILRGVPVIYIDFLGYDEYAHRRGPDSEMSLYNLRGIDAAIAKIDRAAQAVPEYGYEVYVFSDHGQSATTPFERVVGCDLQSFVLGHAAHGITSRTLEAQVIRELVETREARFWLRTLWRPLRAPVQLYIWWLERRLARRGHDSDRSSLEGIRVVTGGSIAHLYFARAGGASPMRAPTVEEVEGQHPGLIDALSTCPAIGLVVGQGAGGPVVYHRGRRYPLADRRALEALEPFRVLGYELLAGHLHEAASGRRSGDLVLYGAFSEVGDVSFDFEFGSHGGLSPEELDQFVLHPAAVELPLHGAVRAEDFYRIFRERFLDTAKPEKTQHAA
jgi:hypothetical protein